VLDGSGHATRRQVWIGVSNRVSAEVLNGLTPGDVVVLGRQSGGETAEAAANGSKGGRGGIGRLF
jgi:macrolide-specific efflux system membrane fusion protein